MTGVGDDSRGRPWGKPWLVVGFVLAVGATVALVISEDMRWLRLGIVAALWAALIGAFVAAKYRRQVTATEDEVAQAQAVYELELEREIAARREFELEIEAETRDRVEASSREELEALRSEVIALRESLQTLFGGEVLFEQVALTAQATRMRSLNENQQQRLVQAGGDVSPRRPQIAAAPKKQERVIDVEPKTDISGSLNPPTEQNAPVPPRRPEREEATRRVPPARVKRPEEPRRPPQRPADPPTRDIAAVLDGPVRPQQPPRTPQPVVKPAAERRPRPPVERVRQQRPPEPKPAPKPAEPVEELPPLPQPKATPKPQPKPEPAPEPVLADLQLGDWSPSWENGRSNGTNGSNGRPARRAEPEPEAPRRNPTLPVEIRDVPASGGRRRRAEAADPAPSQPANGTPKPPQPQPEPASGGRRRRPDGEPPSWERKADSGSRHASGSHAKPDAGDSRVSGSHARPDAEPRRRRAEEPEPPARDGSHAAGRSVTELLAAHGATGATPRRRRRAD
ncbi:DUF6779 domain-containing protein [Amycolatopsis suaedae]|uniref:DUF6779 domain-containing protein n=1 Tax=Amycolatopsis suaedae TaxID=2510978 RepID=A0A4V2ELI1_9PSEU|nr:DUF6779 domain-containing protein [Amycolatopsis suaedae]RZQ61645.1 hypothetical protein EWH70_22025 [Amycolatopsis suaedae]